VRELRVLEPATLCLLTDRRRHPPAGRVGGDPGACGVNLLDGAELPAKVTLDLEAGQVVTVMTPGGGGFGPYDRTR
jgi:N-methylhydantoinase B